MNDVLNYIFRRLWYDYTLKNQKDEYNLSVSH